MSAGAATSARAARPLRGPPGQSPAALEVPFVPEKAAAVRRGDRQDGRAAARAALGGVARALAAAALSAAAIAGAVRATAWATRAPAFAVTAVEFRGLVHAREDDLLRRSGLSPGQNLFRADLGVAARALQAHPWVKSVRLFRVPPSRVLALVQEHVPVAQVQLGALYLLDADGALFKRASAGDGVDLPLVTGLARADVAAGRPEVQLHLFAALQLLDAWRDEGLPPGQLEELRFDEDGQVTAFARDDRGGEGKLQEIRVGGRDFAQRLRKLVQVRAALARRGERAARIDLDNEARPDWVAAQLDQTSSAERPR